MLLILAIPTVLVLGQTTLDFTGRYGAKRPSKPFKPETRITVWRSSVRCEISGDPAHKAVLVC